MPLKTQKATAAGRLIGYAGVSTEEQDTDPQRDERCLSLLEAYAPMAHSVCGPLGPPLELSTAKSYSQ